MVVSHSTGGQQDETQLHMIIATVAS